MRLVCPIFPKQSKPGRVNLPYMVELLDKMNDYQVGFFMNGQLLRTRDYFYQCRVFPTALQMNGVPFRHIVLPVKYFRPFLS